MRPMYGCPDNFRESLTTPTATFPEMFKGLLFVAAAAATTTRTTTILLLLVVLLLYYRNTQTPF